MSSNIAIKNISFTSGEITSGDNGKRFVVMADVNIEFLIIGKYSVLEGEIDVDFEEYKEMTHNELTRYIENEIKEQF